MKTVDNTRDPNLLKNEESNRNTNADEKLRNTDPQNQDPAKHPEPGKEPWKNPDPTSPEKERTNTNPYAGKENGKETDRTTTEENDEDETKTDNRLNPTAEKENETPGQKTYKPGFTEDEKNRTSNADVDRDQQKDYNDLG